MVTETSGQRQVRLAIIDKKKAEAQVRRRNVLLSQMMDAAYGCPKCYPKLCKVLKDAGWGVKDRTPAPTRKKGVLESFFS